MRGLGEEQMLFYAKLSLQTVNFCVCNEYCDLEDTLSLQGIDQSKDGHIMLSRVFSSILLKYKGIILCRCNIRGL